MAYYSPATPPRTSGSGPEYDVFLSFRGKDTRKSFAAHLYQDLVRAGIRTFRDEEELRIGEDIGQQLFEAIAVSRLCLPLLSRNYASSKWCRTELVRMVGSGVPVLPVFLDMDFSAAGRCLTKDASSCGALNEEEEETWQAAVTEVLRFPGLCLRLDAHGCSNETRKRLASHLCKALSRSRVQTLVSINTDNACLKGPRVFVVLFSTRYGFSTNRLDELTKAMDMKNLGKLSVFPVFVDVEPYEVKKQAGCFKEAFAFHEQTVGNRESVERWRKALWEAGSLKGWHLKNVSNGFQSKVCCLDCETSSLIMPAFVIVLYGILLPAN